MLSKPLISIKWTGPLWNQVISAPIDRFRHEGYACLPHETKLTHQSTIYAQMSSTCGTILVVASTVHPRNHMFVIALVRGTLGLLHCHWCNLTTCTMKQPWRIWVNRSCASTRSSKYKDNTTKYKNCVVYVRCIVHPGPTVTNLVNQGPAKQLLRNSWHLTNMGYRL